MTRLNSLILEGEIDEALRFWRESGLSADPEAARDLGPRIARLERQRGASAQTRDASVLPPLPDIADQPPRPERVERPERSWPTVPERPVGDLIERLRSAIQTGDAAAIGAIWPSVRHDPAASPYTLKASEVVTKLMHAAIAGAIERGNDTALIAAVRDAEAAGVAVTAAARRAARAAARREESRERLRGAIARDDRPALAELAVSGRLAEIGPIDADTRRTVARAVQWPHLERAFARDDDEAILSAFDGEAFAAPDALTPEQRARIDLAHRRVTWVETTRRALRRRDVAVLRSNLAVVPQDAERRLSRTERERIERLVAQADAVADLEATLAARDDERILTALSRLEETGATLPETLDWSAMRVVVDRMSLVAAVRRAATMEPRDYARLARLLPAVRRAREDGPLDLGQGIDLAELEEDLRREAHRQRLREAIARGDDKAILAAANPDPYGTLATLSPEERARVDAVLTGAPAG